MLEFSTFKSYFAHILHKNRYNCFRVSGLVQVFHVSYIIVTRVRVRKVNMDHCG